MPRDPGNLRGTRTVSPEKLYEPRRAQESPLYRILQDHLETFRRQVREVSEQDRVSVFSGDTDRTLGAFLECGIPRFGLTRYLCRSCGQDLFVPFSCKQRLACPSCDHKRSLLTSTHALENLLPCVPCRQWVLSVPKRLRYFLERNAALPGEISRLLAQVLTRFYQDRSSAPLTAAPAQIHFVQRFGSTVNLHIHLHAVVSDGVFDLQEGHLLWIPTPDPTVEEVIQITESLKGCILSRFSRIGAIPEAAASELAAREHSGFSLHGGVRIAAQDRKALQRLLSYCTRPAIAIGRLEYFPDQDRVRYRPKKTRPGEPALLEWPSLGFIQRWVPLIPPPCWNLARYSGALGARSHLRDTVTLAAKLQAPEDALLVGWKKPRLPTRVHSTLGGLKTAASQSWALCLRRVFEATPLLCRSCGAEMQPVAVIMNDSDLVKILPCLGLPTGFPILKSARAPPLGLTFHSQIDPRTEADPDQSDQMPGR